MSLEDDLKAKTLALISRQMANWVVDIQRHIQRHQETWCARSTNCRDGGPLRREDRRGRDRPAHGRGRRQPAATATAAARGAGRAGLAELRASLAAIEKVQQPERGR